MKHIALILATILLTLSVGYVSATNAQESEVSGGGSGGGSGTVTAGGGGSGTTNSMPYFSGATELSSGPLYRAAAARVGLGGTTDSEPGFRWAGTTIDFVTAGNSSFIRVNALEYQMNNSSIIKNSSDGLIEVTDVFGGAGGVKVVEIQNGTSKTLVDTTATPFVEIAVPQGSAVGGIIEYTITFSTGGNLEMESGTLYFAGTNEAGTELAIVTENGTNTQVPAGTMTTDFSVSYGTDTVIISVDADSTALTVAPVISFRVLVNSGMATVTYP